MQSGHDKLSCRSIALKHGTKTEHLRNWFRVLPWNVDQSLTEVWEKLSHWSNLSYRILKSNRSKHIAIIQTIVFILLEGYGEFGGSPSLTNDSGYVWVGRGLWRCALPFSMEQVSLFGCCRLERVRPVVSLELLSLKNSVQSSHSGPSAALKHWPSNLTDIHVESTTLSQVWDRQRLTASSSSCGPQALEVIGDQTSNRHHVVSRLQEHSAIGRV